MLPYIPYWRRKQVTFTLDPKGVNIDNTHFQWRDIYGFKTGKKLAEEIHEQKKDLSKTLNIPLNTSNGKKSALAIHILLDKKQWRSKPLFFNTIEEYQTAIFILKKYTPEK